ncbi:MAG: hypothetical protein VX447_13220 [Pseudomonadota bacterium]|uniref:hypothetical protein n=1 Tax=Gallaecimonas pentaromativorans TaxID=584787 RepID=UPI00067E766B|nr:hypothetical protein [Gallaecimonas pentaromativorans]MED5525698.1 hypothetical protein [Pseudomonadota bacterium]
MESEQKTRPRLDNSELVKTGFWVGQVFMLLATVLGVYLAAQQGLSQAITFSDIDDQQKNYYLRRSLHDELADNVRIVREYADAVEKERPFDLTEYHPRLQTFIWNNMRYSDQTLQTPSEFLTAARRFYAGVDELVGKGEKAIYARAYFVPRLRALADDMEQHTLKDMQADTDQLKAQLASLGVTVN